MSVILSTSAAYEGWGRLLIAVIRTDDGEEIRREVEDHGAAVAVLPYDPGRRVALLVRQLRAPALLAGGMQSLLEVPAGRLENEVPERAARREALEEAGLRLDAVEKVGTTWSMPAVSTEQIHLFLAAYSAADLIGPGGGLREEGEDITLVEVSLRDLQNHAETGMTTDLKTICLVQALRLRRPDLFGSE